MRSGRFSFFEMLFHGFGIVRRGFALFERYRIRRTGGETVAEPVAVILAEKHGFSVLHSDRAFVTGFGAESAAAAFVSVDFYYSSFHDFFPSIRKKYPKMLISLDLTCQLYYNEDEKAVVRTTKFKKIRYVSKNYFADRFYIRKGRVPDPDSADYAPSAAARPRFIENRLFCRLA